MVDIIEIIMEYSYIGIFFLLNMLRDNYFIAFLLIIPLFILKIQLFAFFILYFIMPVSGCHSLTSRTLESLSLQDYDKYQTWPQNTIQVFMLINKLQWVYTYNLNFLGCHALTLIKNFLLRCFGSVVTKPESDYELELEDLDNAFYIYK